MHVQNHESTTFTNRWIVCCYVSGNDLVTIGEYLWIVWGLFGDSLEFMWDCVEIMLRYVEIC